MDCSRQVVSRPVTLEGLSRHIAKSGCPPARTMEHRNRPMFGLLAVSKIHYYLITSLIILVHLLRLTTCKGPTTVRLVNLIFILNPYNLQAVTGARHSDAPARDAFRF
jgi:hypothetical protein